MTTRPVALITGATAGLGYEFARQLAGRGHDLVLVARDPVRLAERVEELRNAHGVGVRFIAADLSTDTGLAAVTGDIAAHDDVAVLVNNAGFGTTGLFRSTDASRQDQMVRLHVVAVNALTRAVLPGMSRRGRGSIVTVASVASWLTSAGNVNYTATKAYQRVLMESLSLETAGTGVQVQALCPGFTRTEFHARASIRMTHVPEILWLRAEDVVADSLAALDRGGPVVVVPGAIYKVIVLLVRFTPRWLLKGLMGIYRRDRTG